MKKSKLLKYKDYLGSVEFDLNSLVLYGKIQFINDTVTYEASSVEELKAEFELAVEDYLETCATIGKEPQKAYSGTFNVRIGEELHRDAVVCSLKKGVKLNEFCRDAIAEKIEAINSAETDKDPIVQINLIDPSKADFMKADLLDTQYLALSTDLDETHEKQDFSH